MYEYITGTVESIHPEYIVLDNNGIGYQIITPNPFQFIQDGKKQKVYIYYHVREDAVTLYGFLTREEKIFFTKLLNVSGIGPKSALAILAAGNPHQIALAIEQENEKFLISFPSVGKKTARQIILDLKGKLDEFISTADSDVQKIRDEENPELEEALLALEALGYSQREIQKILPVLEKQKLTSDQYIKLALQNFVS